MLVARSYSNGAETCIATPLVHAWPQCPLTSSVVVKSDLSNALALGFGRSSTGGVAEVAAVGLLVAPSCWAARVSGELAVGRTGVAGCFEARLSPPATSATAVRRPQLPSDDRGK